MKVLITGGTGFIGKQLVKACIKKGDQVTVLTRSSRSQGRIKKVGATPLVGKMDNLAFLKKAIKGMEIVYHLAAIRSDWGYSWKEYYQANVLGTKNLLTASLGQVKHFILVSSVKADEPTTLYGKSKLQAEKIALQFFKRKNLPLTIIRPAIVYGPGDSASGMMPKLIKLIRKGFFLIVGSGKNRLHLVYIDDLIQALLLAAEKKGRGRIYIVAGQKPIKLKKLVSLIAKECRARVFPFKVPIPLANLAGLVLEKLFSCEPPVTRHKVKTITADKIYDISKTRKELGYSPKIDYYQGAKKTVRWYLKRWN